MLTHKTLASICLIFGAIFHFVYFFFYYSFSRIYDWSIFLAWITVLLLFVMYFFTNWKTCVKSGFSIHLYRITLIIFLVALLRSVFAVHGIKELKWLLFDSYTGLSLFPALFFVIGCNSKFFSSVNKILLGYCIIASVVSVIYINKFELAVFLLMPIFYIIVTTPIQPKGIRLLIMVISVFIISVSLTHRAGLMRIIIGYLIVLIYYLIMKIKINKTLLNTLIFCILMMPFVFLYLGSKGYNVFHNVLDETTDDYSETNLRIDTRTFLYTEVLTDLKISKALVLGKGIEGGYASESFQTTARKGVEVGFLQILLKSGILGFVIYLVILFTAAFKALGRSNNLFMKCLGLLLVSYFLMFFIENVLAFDLLNIVFWLIVGMCNSEVLLKSNDNEIRSLFLKG